MTKNHSSVESLKLLLVEDSPSLAAVYTEYLRDDSYHIEVVENGQAALAALSESRYDLVLLDLHLPDMPGMEILEEIHDSSPETGVIIITAHGSVETAVEAMQLGALDFLSKPFDATRLRVTVRNSLNNRHLQEVIEQYESSLERDHYHQFVGRSLPMQTVYRLIDNAATSKATIFITGESGTGKELCADSIHKQSKRHSGPFIAINCAAIPRDLMESEIFGHLKGAFTGASTRRDGAATLANGGTLFLDEICEMDLELQGKLLRFIQTGKFSRVGSSTEESVDIRFVCATNRDPLEEVKSGRFREDLYYRLNVIPLHLPPLRTRGDDVLVIAEHLLRQISAEEDKQFTDFTQDARAAMLLYHWPGNVRELQNVVRHAVVLNHGELINKGMLNLDLSKPKVQSSPAPVKPADVEHVSSDQKPQGEIRPLWLEEKAIIERAIAKCDGNIPKAAALLDISASTIYRKKSSWK